MAKKYRASRFGKPNKFDNNFYLTPISVFVRNNCICSTCNEEVSLNNLNLPCPACGFDVIMLKDETCIRIFERNTRKDK